MPAQAGPRRRGARREARAASGTPRPPLGERPRGNGLPPLFSLLLSFGGSRWRARMGTVRFLACPHPSSRAPASSAFVCAAPRARGGARACGGSGAAARPAWRAGSSRAGPRGFCTAPAWQEGPPPTSSRPCAHLPWAAAPVLMQLPCAVTGGRPN